LKLRPCWLRTLEFEARLRRAASKLVRINREGLPLLRKCLREHPLSTPIAWRGCSDGLIERLGRLRRGRHI